MTGRRRGRLTGSGTSGSRKCANCQVAVSVHAASDTASCPLQRRPFLPKEWDADTDRRTATRIPLEVTHREKRRLALDMLDTLADGGLSPPVVVVDAAYGTDAHLRADLANRGTDYVLARADAGWHHHVTLVTAAHAFLTEQRLAPKAPASGSLSTRPSTPSRMP
ncbi:transposase [Streptomyces salinarius]